MLSNRLLTGTLTLVIIISITALIIAFGRGYRLNLQTNTLAPTGLLVASSFPTGAQVYVDNHLVSATNNTIVLPPGTYQVQISKDGYTPWQKTLKIQGEIVTKADALLLPVAPDLRPLTTTGALNPTLSLDGTKIAYGVATASAQKQGLWVMDLTDRPLSLQSPARQIALDTDLIKYSQSKLIWAPNGHQLIAKVENIYYLLNTDGLNDTPQDITLTNDLQFSNWILEYTERQDALVKTLKTVLQKYIREDMKILSWSPDETKILYIATNSATLKPVIIPPLIGTNSQPEDREIKTGKIYIYDIKEDRNYEIPASLFSLPASIYWLMSSRHIVYIEDSKIIVIEYDGQNKTIVYSGPFDRKLLLPHPDGSRLIILTNFNSSSLPLNLYTLSLR